ncbi:cytochrome-c peroxidase [Engelhardtia mirabilis]|uniref:Cytochrome c551 peroxidase n=1 Tax=Engelhardtia mirabilis TaxID=2528011 RepID=A0A518BJ12_9BACT|nr:Cytochrome c551 peroxidase precursor [Planctomycetes bacterium Pla133]QDV01282.1 Cytochrome c551 peroxidase precursor [Planctomycetes bacterium Pla86]
MHAIDLARNNGPALLGASLAVVAVVVFAAIRAGSPQAASAPSADPNRSLTPLLVDRVPLGLDWEPASYRGRTTIEPATVALGERLFFDPRLSRSGQMTCATCHQPERAFTDGRALGRGDSGELVGRNAPTILNRGTGTHQFWDGRAEDLAAQALGPMLSEVEMGLTHELFSERFGSDPEMVREFREVFGSGPDLELAARAIAAFEATLVTANSPFDRFEWGGEREALSEAAQRGLRLFRQEAGCTTCHTGTNFTDELFHNLGVGFDGTSSRPGRFAVTGDHDDLGRYKTPTLRNVELTAPYMHDGSLETLDDVLTFYNEGGRANPNLDPELRPLDLSPAQLEDLRAFLESLTGPVFRLDSGLFREGARDGHAD